MARAKPQRGTAAWAWRLLGEIAAEADRPGVPEAETAYREALTQATGLGMLKGTLIRDRRSEP